MADIEYDSGDDYHDGGIVIDVKDEELRIEDIEQALDSWGEYDELLVDFEGDQDYEVGSP